MAILDQRSQMRPQVALSRTTAGSGTIIDTKGYDLGITFVSYLSSSSGSGTVDLILYESDDPAMAGKTAVAAEKIFPYSVAQLTKTATDAESSFLDTSVGVVSTKRYLQWDISVAGFTGIQMNIIGLYGTKLVAFDRTP